MSIYQFETAEDVDLGSTYVSQEGTYHFVVNEMEDRPQDESGREQDYLQVTAIVLDGTTDIVGDLPDLALQCGTLLGSGHTMVVPSWSDSQVVLAKHASSRVTLWA